jgi:GNAT superfamily N-acetyltransferase
MTDAPILRGMQAPDIRPARPDELVACATVWRLATNDYLARLHQVEIPDDLTGITKLYQHLQATDPGRFLVATRSDPTDAEPHRERIVAFVSAVERGDLWFLSMLFVLPEEQASGIGRQLLDHVLPDPARGMTLGTATDSAQPISNALYSRYGMVPRMPLLDLTGELRFPERLASLPDGVTATPFEDVVGEGGTAGAADGAAGAGHRRLASIVNALDRDTLGVEHSQDHAWMRTTERRGFLYRSAGGDVLGYGYGSPVGRVGPVAVVDPSLVPPILGHLLRAIPARGASAIWTPGHAGEAVRMLLDAGLRLEPFPILLCWSDARTDYTRYLPISPGLL